MDLQELIQRGRFIMADAPERLLVFESVNGKRTAKDMAKIHRRHVNSIRRDLNLLLDSGLIEQMVKQGAPLKKDGFPVYDKVALSRTVPSRYFKSPTVNLKRHNKASSRRDKKNLVKKRRPKILPSLTEQEILDMAKSGESQTVEFKGQGTEARKITREIAAFLNTQEGGYVLYGIDDEGNLEGSDLKAQKLDQSVQNSVRHSISPPATIRIHSVSVLGTLIIVIIVPPWNRRDVYMYDEKVLIRRGTNVFAVKSDESKKLHSGKPVI